MKIGVILCALLVALISVFTGCKEDFVEPKPPTVIIEDDPDAPAICAEVSCGLGGRCVELAGAALCSCPEGKIPNGTTCEDAPMTPALVINVLGGAATSRAGGQVFLAVQLSGPPTHSVSAPLKVSLPDQASLNVPELIIVPEAWRTPQIITVTGLAGGAGADAPYFVVAGPTASQDPLFTGLERSVALTNVDALCGDGVMGGQEQCDEPGASQRCPYGQDGCMVCGPACQYVPGEPAGQCGDGVVQADADEACDEPGASQRCPYGQASCEVCSPSCQRVAGASGGACGDGALQADGGEQCDEPARSRCAYGQMSCQVCDVSCRLVAGEPGERCGDGVVQAAQGEVCDGAQGVQGTCAAQGLPFGGAARCGEDCQLSFDHCDGVAQIAAGRGHSCAVMVSGEVYCWGDGGGRLGDGTEQARTRPVKVVGITDAVQVSAGYAHTCALLASGAVRCWGANYYGQLGRGNTGDPSLVPVAVTGITDAFQISAGYDHTCAILQDNTARCWGRNEYGQLGDGSTTDRRTPTRVNGINDVTQLSAGDGHTCALDLLAGAVCWGRNASGQLGFDGFGDRLAPVPVAGLNGAEFIAAGAQHSCAVLATGGVRCWGGNQRGQLGDGTTADRRQPVDVLGVSGAESVSLGTAHSCAALAGGAGARCWGGGEEGQLGDGAGAARLEAVSVTGLTAPTQLSASGLHSCAVQADKRALCWGYNFYGQLGDGGMTQRRAPVAPAFGL